MNRKLYLALFFLIIIFALITRLIPPLGNDFYFTMDQGNDAVHVREIIERHRLLLKGPETGLKGLYAGPLWYYFLAPGFFIFGGHPFGGLFLLILLNSAALATLMRTIAKNVNEQAALAIGTALSFFWWFYDASRFAFNPFPLVALSFILIILLTLTSQKQKLFPLAAIPVGLAFHTEVAGAIAFFLMYALVGSIFLAKRKITTKHIFCSVLVLFVFFLPYILSDLSTSFTQTKVVIREFEEPTGYTAQSSFAKISREFLKIISNTTIPQNTLAGLGVIGLVLILYYFPRHKKSQTNSFGDNFAFLSFILLAISWIWFSLTTGWRAWHTVYLEPILFISILLILVSLPRKVAAPIFFIIMIFQISFFIKLYKANLKSSDDPSILKNELAAVDWTYQKSEGQGFSAYSYLPSVEDYPYQYLYWWYGRKAYGYVPCEYSTFPGTPDFFVPGYKNYQEPKRECTNLRFLIIEPDEHKELRQKWLEQTRKDTILKEEKKFGQVTIEKRLDEKN